MFDPTINAGHVLTFLSVIAAVAATWSTLDKRVVVLERDMTYQSSRDAAQDAAIRDKFDEIRESLRDMKQQVSEIRRYSVKEQK